MTEEEYQRTAWVFESSLTRPNGTHVQVTITVPAVAAHLDAPETAEITHKTAMFALTQITEAEGRPPF